MQLNRYFDRIDYKGSPTATIGTLQTLQRAHLCAVPFENLDVQFGRRVSTGIEAAYDKIVGRGRGGWCYEQNGLFGWALAEIGFDVTRVAASVMRAERGDVSLANHLCLLVQCEDSAATWLADVGFGGSLIKPIELAEGACSQPPYELGLRRLDGNAWQFWENLGDGDFSFDFAAESGDEAAMLRRCDYLQSSPDSSFVLNLVAQLRTPDSHLSLRGRVFRKVHPGGAQQRTIDSAAELVEVLADEFGIDVPEAHDLWPRITARHLGVMGDHG